MITHELLLSRVRYDPKTGRFTRLTNSGTHRAGEVCGFTRPNGYVDIGVGRETFRAHRLAWLYMTGDWPTGQIDHINGVRNDNRWANLRQVTASLNCQNRVNPRAGSRSGLIGAHYIKHGALKWGASIMVEGKPIRLGRFVSAEEAHAAYMKAKASLHPGYAALRTQSIP